MVQVHVLVQVRVHVHADGARGQPSLHRVIIRIIHSHWNEGWAPPAFELASAVSFAVLNSVPDAPSSGRRHKTAL
jgi:hypothetical protein